MSRTRYFDFRAPDSTKLFNDSNRGMIEAGVYIGYNVDVGSSGGWYLKFTHDDDPDNTGLFLGKLVTHDGVVIEETDEEQDNVCEGSVSAGTPNIHYAVASYIYNQALPNNDVAYLVRQGTPGVVGVSPPVPPTLADDDTLIAKIYLPSGASSYSYTGVQIQTVGKKSFYAQSNGGTLALDGVIPPGIYDGMVMSEGGTDLDVTLGAGTWVTQENFEVEEAADQDDLVTLSNPGANYYAYAWLIAAHKYEDTDPPPSADYLLVEGTPAAVGSDSTPPTDAEIATAVAAVNIKYDDDWDGSAEASYINKIGLIRVENRSGTYFIQYYRGETYLEPNTLTVYGSEVQALNRSGYYFGADGLARAIADVYAITATREDLDTHYTILVDGEVRAPDTPVQIPSHVTLRALGAASKVLSDDADSVVRIHGLARVKGGTDMFSSVNTVGSPTYTVPSGYVAREFTLNAAYQTGDDLETLLLSYGDPLTMYSTLNTTVYTGWVAKVTDTWVLEAVVEDQYNTDGNPVDTDLLIQKKNAGIEGGLEVGRINTGSGALSVKYVTDCRFDTKCRQYRCNIVENSMFDRFEVGAGGCYWSDLSGSWVSSFSTMDKYNQHNRYDQVVLLGTGGDEIMYNERKSSVGHLFTPNSAHSLAASGCNIQCVIGDIGMDGYDIIIGSVSGTVTDLATNPSRFRVLNTGVTGLISPVTDALEGLNQDRNLKLVSDAQLTWNATTELLTWDDDILIDIPTTTGYNSIAANPTGTSMSTSGDRLYVDLVRNATGTSAVSVVLQTKANAANSAKYPHRFLFATRYQDVVYLWDGTRIEDGQSVSLGATPPPDGSVTYRKLAADAVAFHNKFYRDYVSVEDNSGWTNELHAVPDAGSGISYTESTGLVQYGGLVSLAFAQALFDAGVPLSIIFRDVDYGSHGVHNRHEIIDMDYTTGKAWVRKYLGISALVGTNHVWNGAIVSGSLLCSNRSLSAFSYDAQGTNPGRITYAAGIGFSSTQIHGGAVFVDNAGVKYPILDYDTSGNGSWVKIPTGLRDVSTGTPTDQYGGSIHENNNPYDIALSDLRPLAGGEFIPIDMPGDIDQSPSGVVTPMMGYMYQVDRRFVRPYDPRVRVWTGYYTQSSYQIQSDRWYPAGMYRAIEVTGVFTDVALVVGGGSTGGSNAVWLDGKYYAGLNTFYDGVYDNVYDADINRYELVTDNYLMKLPQGIHNVVFFLDENVPVRGVYVVNAPPHTNICSRSPGKLVRSGGVETYTTPMQRSILTPTPSSGWNKGGRVLQLLLTSGTMDWATNWTRNFTDVGETNGTTSIVNVGDVTQWRIGDAVMVFVSNVKLIRKVTNIVSDTLVVDSTIPTSGGQITLYYYGQLFDSTTATRNYWRHNEELAETFSVREFAGPGDWYNSKSTVGNNGTQRSSSVYVGIRLSDLTTGIAQGDSSYLYEGSYGSLSIQTTSTKLKIWFVGTGLSLHRVAGGTDDTLDVYVDGVDSGTISTGDTEKDFGIFICGELPYGSHCVLLESKSSGSPSVQISGFSVWQTKKPTNYVGFPLLDTNVVSDSELELDPSSTMYMTGPYMPQLGTVNVDFLSIAHPYNAPLTDADNAYLDTTGRCAEIVFGVSSEIYIPFFGDEISIVHGNISLAGGSSIAVKFLDHDGTYKAPSSITGYGFDVSSDYFPSTGSYSGKRLQFKLEETGFYLVQITPGQSGDTIRFDSVEIHSPFHNYKSKFPTSVDHTQPLQFSGLDVRNLTPFDPTHLPTAQVEHSQGALLNTNSSITIDHQHPFVFYSKGGTTEITVTFEAAYYSGLGSMNFWTIVDGNGQGNDIAIAVGGLTLGDTHCVSLSATLHMKPGMHWATISSNSTGEVIRNTMWKARSLSTVSAGLLSSSILGNMGPVNPNKSGL